ncbi:MAG: dTDP-4-amino-4,6-dideoxygalactose transaminase [Promethearchaeota archaeon]
MKYKIPFNKPFIVGKELHYISQAVLSGKISGDGIFTRKCQKYLEEQMGAKKVLLTHSCTAALEMSAILCGIEKGDEVIIPSYTFVSTANAFYLRGADIKFVDIREDNLNIDESKIEQLITEKTKVIVPVHYGGISCEMDKIMELAKQYELKIIEDAAQGLGAKYKGIPLGTIGDFGTISFHETKNVISGEGGAIVINNEEHIERAEIIWEKGTNRKKFYRGEVDKYTWVDVGSSFLPSDIVAAFLYAQLENIDFINNKRKMLFENYYNGLKVLEDDGILKLPYGSNKCDGSYHIFYIILNDNQTRDDLMGFLKNKGILSVFHYIPLHLSPVGRKMGYSDGDLPITEDLSWKLLRLPLFFELNFNDQEDIIREIKEFFNYK